VLPQEKDLHTTSLPKESEVRNLASALELHCMRMCKGVHRWLARRRARLANV
jgi:predicted DNA-binding ribbon-helix-helix protein